MSHGCWTPVRGCNELFMDEATSDKACSTLEAAMESALTDPVKNNIKFYNDQILPASILFKVCVLK